MNNDVIIKGMKLYNKAKKLLQEKKNKEEFQTRQLELRLMYLNLNSHFGIYKDE